MRTVFKTTEAIKDGSSAIESLGYNGNDGVLTIEFTTAGKYEYFSVPRSVAQKVLSAPSQGRAFHRHIRGQFEYERIE